MAEVIKNNILQNAGAKGAAYIVPGDGALDARFVATTEATLTDANGWQLTLNGAVVKTLPYVGLTTYTKDTGKLWICTAVGETDVFQGIQWKEVGKETEVPVKGITLNTKEQTPDENGIVHLTLDASDVNVDLSNYYTKTESENKFVEKVTGKDLSANDFTDTLKTKLDNLANITSVSGDLSLTDGVLSVTIPEVEVPVKSIKSDDKLLTLSESGELSSTITFTKEDVDGEECLVVKGKNGDVIGKVETAAFTADSFLDDVEIANGNINFTWAMADGSSKTDSVNLSNYISPYSGDNVTVELDSTTNVFSVKDGVFVKTADIKTVATTGSYNDLIDKPTIPSTVAELTDATDYAKANDVYSKTAADNAFVAKEGFNEFTATMESKLDGIAEGAQVNVIESILVKTSTDSDAEALDIVDKKVTIDLSDIDSRLDTLDSLISGGADGEGITEIIAGKQDKLTNGSSTQPHLIWDSTNTKWAPGKINLNDIVPSENKAANSVLIWDGSTTAWSSVEVHPELPQEGRVAGYVLKVSDKEGEDVVWAAEAVTTVTNTLENGKVISSIINDGTNSVEVYSKDSVDQMLTWHSI